MKSKNIKTNIKSRSRTLFVYTRTAADNSGHSINMQKCAGRLKAFALGMNPVLYDEGVKSGNTNSFTETPVLGSILNKAIRGEVKNLYVFDLSRFSRNRGTLEYILNVLKENKVKIYTSLGIYKWQHDDEELIKAIRNIFNQNQKKWKRIKARKN